MKLNLSQLKFIEFHFSNQNEMKRKKYTQRPEREKAMESKKNEWAR